MKHLLILFLIIQTATVNSQVYVGIRDYYGEKTKPNSPKLIERIKGSKILFILPDIFSKEDYEKVLSTSWKFGEYELVPIKEFNENKSKYLKVSTVVAEYNGILKTVNYNNPDKIIKQNEYVFIDIHFYIVDNVKVGKKETTYEKTYFGNISFTPDYPKLRNDGFYNYTDISPNYLRNYKLGYLKNYFSLFSTKLLANTLQDGYADFENKAELMKLKTQKLYIVENVKQKNLGFNRDDRDLNELTSDYQYPKLFLSEEELNAKILAGEEFYYLFYNQDNSKKIISVVNSKSGELIYNTLERMSFVIKDKDFKELNKVISKS